MNEYEFVNLLEDMVKAWKYQNDVESPSNKEILMWRERFLESKKNIRKMGEMVFLAIPSEKMMEYGPEYYFQDEKE